MMCSGKRIQSVPKKQNGWLTLEGSTSDTSNASSNASSKAAVAANATVSTANATKSTTNATVATDATVATAETTIAATDTAVASVAGIGSVPRVIVVRGREDVDYGPNVVDGHKVGLGRDRDGSDRDGGGGSIAKVTTISAARAATNTTDTPNTALGGDHLEDGERGSQEEGLEGHFAGEVLLDFFGCLCVCLGCGPWKEVVEVTVFFSCLEGEWWNRFIVWEPMDPWYHGAMGIPKTWIPGNKRDDDIVGVSIKRFPRIERLF